MSADLISRLQAMTEVAYRSGTTAPPKLCAHWTDLEDRRHPAGAYCRAVDGEGHSCRYRTHGVEYKHACLCNERWRSTV